MEEKKKNPISKKILIAIFIIMIMTFLIMFVSDRDIKRNGRSSLITEAGIYYLAESSGKFIELTSNGDIYEHDFKGNVKCIEKASDIIFLEESRDSSDDRKQLIIINNGDIYISSNGDYKGEKIGNVEGAISGSISESHVGILTDKGDIYIYGKNKYGGLGLGYIQEVDKFKKINNAPKVKKIICEKYFTFLLTTSGEIYGCGKIGENSYTQFNKFDVIKSAVDMECSAYTVIIPDEYGNIYELGYGLYDMYLSKTYSKFNKVENMKFIKAISQGDDCVVVLNKEQKIYYKGFKTVGKAAGIPIEGSIEGIIKPTNIFCRGRYIYVLTDKNVLRYKLK